MAKLTQQQYDLMKQKGLDDATIESLAKSKGFELPKKTGAIGNTLIGVAKGFVGDIARPVAQAFQGLGQKTLAVLTPASSTEVRKTSGLKSLDDTTPEGQSVVESLKTKGIAQTGGRVGVNIASFFVPAAPAVKVTGTALKTGGRVITRAGIGLSAKEAPLMQAYKAQRPVGERILAAFTGKDLGRPITNAETVVKKNLFGTESMIGVQAKRASNNVWQKVISPALKQNKTVVNMSSFIDNISSQIDNVTELTRKKELQTALQAFKEDYGKVGNVNLEKLQQFKEGWAKFLPEKVYKGKPIAQSFKEIQKLAATQARNTIYSAIDDVKIKAAYFDYGNLKNLQELGQKSMTGSKLKGGAGSFISGIYDKVVTPIATTGGLTLYKTGEGLEFVGRQGAKILGQLFH